MIIDGYGTENVYLVKVATTTSNTRVLLWGEISKSKLHYNDRDNNNDNNNSDDNDNNNNHNNNN